MYLYLHASSNQYISTLATHHSSLLRAKEKERRSSIVYQSKERENYKLIYERERRKNPYRLRKPEPKAEYQCRALLLAMGAGEADGGGQPPASCPSLPASKTKVATGPNPWSTLAVECRVIKKRDCVIHRGYNGLLYIW